jgi:hypothetical protein
MSVLHHIHLIVYTIRIRRWKCCDATSREAKGCCQRGHQPPQFDPIYDKIMVKINERDETEIREVNAQLELSRMAEFPLTLQKLQRNQVNVVEDRLAAERSIIARFDKSTMEVL